MIYGAHFRVIGRTIPSQKVVTGGAPRLSRFERFEQIRNFSQTWIIRQTDVRDLRNLMETNDYHRSSVWHHTLRVAEEGERLLELNFITSPAARDRFEKHLDEVVDPNSENQYTRAELVYAAMWLHDIGKGMNHPAGKVIKSSFSVFGEEAGQVWKCLTFAGCLDGKGAITPSFVEQKGKLRQLFESILNRENRIFEIIGEAKTNETKPNTKHQKTIFAEFGDAQDFVWNLTTEAGCFFSKKGIIDPDFENKREVFRQLIKPVLEHEKAIHAILERGYKTGEQVMTTDEAGKTGAIGHPKIGAPLAAEIAGRKDGLNCSESEAKYIEMIVGNHMEGFNLERDIKDQTGKQSPEDVIAFFFDNVGYDPLVILHAIADVKGSDFDCSATVARHIGIINTRYTLQRKRLSLAQDNAIDQLDALAKTHGIFLVPGELSIESRIRELVEAQLAPRVATGKINADKLPSIVDNRVKKLMGKFKFRPSQPSADAVENNFDFADVEQLKKNPVILEVGLA